MEVILIAAMAANRAIGLNNTIPWHIPGELARFKEVTMGHPLIMGRKTYQSIGHPLAGRRNIVVTRNRDFKAPGAEVVHSLEQGIELCAADDQLFIIGGEELYRLGMAVADTLILTLLPEPVEGDAFFPLFSCPPFILQESVTIRQPVPYTVRTYRKQTLPEQ